MLSVLITAAGKPCFDLWLSPLAVQGQVVQKGSRACLSPQTLSAVIRKIKSFYFWGSDLSLIQTEKNEHKRRRQTVVPNVVFPRFYCCLLGLLLSLGSWRGFEVSILTVFISGHLCFVSRTALIVSSLWESKLEKNIKPEKWFFPPWK